MFDRKIYEDILSWHNYNKIYNFISLKSDSKSIKNLKRRQKTKKKIN